MVDFSKTVLIGCSFIQPKTIKNPSELLKHHMKMPPIILFAVGIALIIFGTYQERKAQQIIEELRFWRTVLRGFNQIDRKDDGETPK